MSTRPKLNSEVLSNPAPEKDVQKVRALDINEQTLMATMLQVDDGTTGRQLFAEAVDATGIQYSDFVSPEVGTLWYVMDRLYQDGSEIDYSTVWAEIQKSDKAKARVPEEIMIYLSSQKTGSHRKHAENIVDASISRAAATALSQLEPIVKNSAIKAKEKIRRINNVVTDLSERVDHATNSQTVKITEGLKLFVEQYHKDEEEGVVDTPITTGFPSLDHKFGGWNKSTLHVIAGAPGSGKTVFLMTSALHAVMSGKRVLLVQLELPINQSFRRLLCAFAGIDSARLKRHQLNHYELSRLPKAVKKLQEFDADNRFTLLQMNRPTLEDLQIKLDTLMLKGYDAIFFDYAGGARIAPNNDRLDDLKHHQQIYTTVDSWKKSYNVPIITGAQYSAPKPQTTPGGYSQDMIYSSSYFKHNADTIMFIHPKKKDENGKQETLFVLPKIRDGESEYGSNAVVSAQPQMNMFRFIEDKNSVGPTLPLWDIYSKQQPRKVDLKDL